MSVIRLLTLFNTGGGKLSFNIKHYKAELMGLAIIFIMFYHSERLPVIGKVQDFGDIGVDIFLFLGAYTCTASYLKFVGAQGMRGIWAYLWRRIRRIVPPYIILWGLVFAISAVMEHETVASFLKNWLLWDSWFHNGRFLWYIPSVLTMYAVLPCYVQACRKWRTMYWMPVALILCNVYMGIIGFEPVPQMTLTRLPIFLLGINLYLAKDSSVPQSGVVVFAILIVLIIGFYLLTKTVLPEYSNLEIKRTCYIPFVLFLVYGWHYKSAFLYSLGILTLEIYLIHEYLVYEPLCEQIGLNPCLSTLVAMPLAVCAAWAYNKLLKYLIYKK